ncbi:glycosyltransferase family A protein [Paraflavitalea sp. CAU 1676]|uniref:glycosyltransferase family 2 protein n=1 Tax=Paraflavitalea sp. CAU 1676 TaxID=3032598 RepID=UPI0023DCBE0E|nr:glycosyltransferase family A protein [Paraflavitalea sp. CAU 1676]MDF2189660.1 glycosyltransferase family A protein [Paraflavitalea sp. CAU 1676]
MITIITPTYNREVLVQTTIRSIQAQSFTDWELIIVDDGSTDNTEAALKPYLADTRIRYIKKHNSGQADSLNTGAAQARGEFITFLDSDDEAYPDWLKTVHEHVKEDSGIICVGAMRKYPDGSMVREGMNQFRFFGKTIYLKFTCGSLFIRRDIFTSIRGYDATLKSNIQTDLGYRLLVYLRNSRLNAVVVNAYLVQINVHEGDRIRTNWKRRREGGIQFIEKHYGFIYENDPKEIANIYGTIAYSSYKLRHRGESVKYLFKAIRHNPVRWVNYMRVVKYAFW